MARTRRVVVVGCDREHLELLKMVLKANNCGGATSTTARGAAMAMMAEYTHLVIVDLITYATIWSRMRVNVFSAA